MVSIGFILVVRGAKAAAKVYFKAGLLVRLRSAQMDGQAAKSGRRALRRGGHDMFAAIVNITRAKLSQPAGIRPEAASGFRVVAYTRYAVVVVLTVAAVFYGMRSMHWGVTGDSTIMHYVNFLMSHGLRPYIDITDNNFPGAYYTEGFAMRVFGDGNLGWRLYEAFLLATMTAALVMIARRRDWLAGIFAGGLFIAIHGAEGPAFAGEREELIVVLVLVAYAAMFASVRRQTPKWMILFGFAYGVAASIKPTFLPLPFALMVLMAIVLRRRKTGVVAYVGFALAGLLAVAAMDVGFLVRYNAIQPFVFILKTISPAYASTARLGVMRLIGLLLPRDLRVLLPILVVLPILVRGRNRLRWSWEEWAIGLGVVFGLASFFVQAKGFNHHRYVFLVPLFLLAGFELLDALKKSGWTRGVTVACIAVILFGIVPMEMRETSPASREVDLITADLERLGGTADLQYKVQCFDMVYGCFGALYDLRIMENTGFTGDLFFFSNTDSAPSKMYQAMFWRLAQRDPANVLIVSNEWFGHDPSFDKLNAWPQFAAYLGDHYTLIVERRLNRNGSERVPRRFRIYVRNDTPLIFKAETLAALAHL